MDEIYHDHHQHFSLLPIDQRKWIPETDVAYFIAEASKLIPKDRFKIQSKTPVENCNPHDLLALLIFSYLNGVYASSRIELLAQSDIRFRYICRYTNPSSDAIYAFRRSNMDSFTESFVTVLLVASELKIPIVGTLPIEDVRTKAAASTKGGKGTNLKVIMKEEFRVLVEDMIQEAERVDNEGGLDSGQQSLPGELTQGNRFHEQLTVAFDSVAADVSG